MALANCLVISAARRAAFRSAFYARSAAPTTAAQSWITTRTPI